MEVFTVKLHLLRKDAHYFTKGNMCANFKGKRFREKRDKVLNFFLKISFSPLTASHGLTEEQTAIYELATDFAAKEMLPNMALWDEKVWTYCL